MTGDPIYEGGCLCGAVRYRAQGTRYHLCNCHCDTCRRVSAAPFVAWASFKAQEFAFVKGEPTRFASSAKAHRTFCPRCGTPLTYQLNAKQDEIDVTICSLDDPQALKPRDHVWTRSKLDWIKLDDGLPAHATDRA
jgi:hypothetical protein